MNRRNWLKRVAGLLLASMAMPDLAMAQEKAGAAGASRARLGVIGTGSFGCRLASHLAGAGEAMLIDRTFPANAPAASQRFALQYNDDEPYDLLSAMDRTETLRPQIESGLAEAEVVLIIAGLGRASGTGAAPVVARIARELGKFVWVACVSPFDFEGKVPAAQADVALQELRKHTHAILHLSNERISRSFKHDVRLDEFLDLMDQPIQSLHSRLCAELSRPGALALGHEAFFQRVLPERHNQRGA